MKDAYYFKHDSNARADISLSAFREDMKESGMISKEHSLRAMNLVGYGFYFIVLEIMREQSDYRLDNTPKTMKYIAKEADLPFSIVEKLINLLLSEEYSLFKEEEGKLYSVRLEQDMADMNDKRSKFSRAGKASAQKRYAVKEGETVSPPPRKRLVFSPRFYSIWNDYIKLEKLEPESISAQLKELEQLYREKETQLTNLLYSALVQEQTKDFYQHAIDLCHNKSAK